MIVIHTPMKCQNDHRGVILVTEFNGGDVIRQYYVGDICSCPKSDFGEGYAPDGDDIIIETDLEFGTM